MRTLEHTVTIDASPDAVWAVLVDTPQWPAWNVVVPDRPPSEGETLRLRLQLPGGWAPSVPATWVEVRPGRALVWCGGPPALFHAVHGFELSPTEEGGCRLRHHETFSGALSGPALRLLERTLLARYAQVNAALKRRVEG
jgi:hypothetical protein